MENTGPVPTSIEWYNPQGQLVSRNNSDEVNQVAGTGGGIGLQYSPSTVTNKAKVESTSAE